MRRFPRSLAAAVLGLSLVAVACGGDDSDSSGSATTAKAGATETTAKAGATTTTAKAGADAAAKDIVDTAVGAGTFTTLAAALTAGGLVETLKGPGPFTVFAPTDDAFKALPAGTLEDLLKVDSKAKLADILKYHVVAGEVMAADVVKLKEAKTVEGKTIKITVSGSTVTLNDTIKVTKTDIKAKNGVIHVIDGVLLPPA